MAAWPGTGFSRTNESLTTLFVFEVLLIHIAALLRRFFNYNCAWNYPVHSALLKLPETICGTLKKLTKLMQLIYSQAMSRRSLVYHGEPLSDKRRLEGMRTHIRGQKDRKGWFSSWGTVKYCIASQAARLQGKVCGKRRLGSEAQ